MFVELKNTRDASAQNLKDIAKQSWKRATKS